VYGVTGTAAVGAAARPWTVVLKVIVLAWILLRSGHPFSRSQGMVASTP
jgi:hypothetical protein